MNMSGEHGGGFIFGSSNGDRQTQFRPISYSDQVFGRISENKSSLIQSVYSQKWSHVDRGLKEEKKSGRTDFNKIFILSRQVVGWVMVAVVESRIKKEEETTCLLL